MLQAAEDSLKALNKNDISEVRALKRPPAGVVLVLEVICIVKDIKPNKVILFMLSMLFKRGNYYGTLIIPLFS